MSDVKASQQSQNRDLLQLNAPANSTNQAQNKVSKFTAEMDKTGMYEKFADDLKERRLAADGKTRSASVIQERLPDGVTDIKSVNDHESVVNRMKHEGHNWAVVALCHQHQRPVHKLPGVAILGTFTEQSLARQWIDSNHKVEQGVSFYIVPTIDPFPITVNEVSFMDVQQRTKIRNDVMAAYQMHLNTNNDQFSKMVESKTAGKVGNSINAIVRKQQAKLENSTRSVVLSEKHKKRVAGMKVAPSTLPCLQPHMLVAFVKDLISDPSKPQPLVSIIAGFYDPAAAEKKGEECKKLVKYFDYDVVQSGCWIYPQHVDDTKIPTTYTGSSQKLQDIMTYRDKENEVLKSDVATLVKESETQKKQVALPPSSQPQPPSSSSSRRPMPKQPLYTA